MSKQNKIAVNFFELARMALVPSNIKKLLAESNFQQEVAFHKMHKRFVEMCREQNTKASNRLENMLHDRYPFVKVNGRWHVSIPKLYMYLVASRGLICKFEDENMVKAHKAIQNAQEYYDDYQALANKLRPRRAQDYREMVELESKAYENYMMKQASIFGGTA